MQLSIFPTSDLGATAFSPCRKYRYLLWRHWGEDWASNYAMFVGLNPSTADEVQDDPTIRRCIKFSKDWGYSGLCMANIFAYRATDPKDMLKIEDPVGVENDGYLMEYAANAGVVIAAWGNHGSHKGRHLEVKAMIPGLHCLRVTKAGMPNHPLYLPQSLTPIAF